jgi:hypothetical protein
VQRGQSNTHAVAGGVFEASLRTCQWVIGGIDFPIRPVDYIPQNHP